MISRSEDFMNKWFAALSLLLTLSSAQNVHAQVSDIIKYVYIGKVSEDRALMTSGHAKFTEINSKSIKALVWNIKKAEMEDWQTEFMTYSAGRDLILIQEAYSKSLFKNTINFFKSFRWDFGVSFLNKRDKAYTGTMIGSKFEARESFVRQSQDLEPVFETPKTMTFAKYPIRGRGDELLVISVHAINMTAPGTFKRHVKIAHEEIARHHGPVLYAGDFNTWSEGRLEHLFNSVKQLGLKTVQFKDGDKRMTFSDNFLDHAFVRGLTVKEAKVIVESKGSDHKPLLLDLELE